MSQKTSELDPALRRLKRRAAELVYKDTDILTVVCGFEFSDTPVSGEAAEEWETQYDYQLMLRAFYCKELTGFTPIELYEYLANAEQFAPDKTAPRRTILGGAGRDRFSGYRKSFITDSVERILAVAHEMGNPFGMHSFETSNNSDSSNRPLQNGESQARD